MKFKCKSTNLIYNFEFEVDIQSMMKHPDYESVPDNESMDESSAEQEEKVKPVKTSKKSSKAATDEEASDSK